jgi:hypothetical protein
MRLQDFDPDLAAELGISASADDRHYQIVYRVADERTAAGSRQERYEAITELLRSMNADEVSIKFADASHVATSTWVVVEQETRASSVLDKLRGALTPGIDILRIVEIVPGNEAEL